MSFLSLVRGQYLLTLCSMDIYIYIYLFILFKLIFFVIFIYLCFFIVAFFWAWSVVNIYFCSMEKIIMNV